MIQVKTKSAKELKELGANSSQMRYANKETVTMQRCGEGWRLGVDKGKNCWTLSMLIFIK